jgi:hypothetical protein
MNNPYFVNQYKPNSFWKNALLFVETILVYISIPFIIIGIGFGYILYLFLSFADNTLFGGHKATKK